MLIEFSGADGSGKTTAMNVFCEQLKARGTSLIQTREVGCPHIPICAELRKLILNPEVQMDGRSMEFVFAAMRLENQKLYDLLRDQYDFVVSDRGWLCHLAYTDHNVAPEFTRDFYINVVRQHSYLPDRIYLFDVDVDIASARRTSRGEAEDAIEAKGLEFQRRVAASYRLYAKAYADEVDIRIVDANQGLEIVRDLMLEEANSLADSCQVA